MKSAKEFWKEKFQEYPQNDAEKLAVAMMTEYATFMHTHLSESHEKEIAELKNENEGLKCGFMCNKNGIKRFGESCTLNNNCEFPDCIKRGKITKMKEYQQQQAFAEEIIRQQQITIDQKNAQFKSLTDQHEKEVEEILFNLKDFWHDVRPHINGHNTAMKKFTKAINSLESLKSKMK